MDGSARRQIKNIFFIVLFFKFLFKQLYKQGIFLRQVHGSLRFRLRRREVAQFQRRPEFAYLCDRAFSGFRETLLYRFDGLFYRERAHLYAALVGKVIHEGIVKHRNRLPPFSRLLSGFRSGLYPGGFPLSLAELE